MATLFQLPKASPVSAGNSYALARLYFYQAGTTTKITTYTTSALSVANANPVVADANGVFPPIFVNEGTNTTYRVQLKTSAEVLVYDVDNVPAGLNQTTVGAALWPQTAAELAAAITPTRFQFPPGNLKRYTSNDGDGSDIAAAFETMLACGEKLCFVPAPTTTWGISSQIDWVSGVSVRCGRGTSFTSARASGEWTFKFSGIPYGAGAEFVGFILNITNAGARGIQIWESRNVYLDRCEIRGPAGIGGIGIEMNGGDDASPTWGAAHNVIGDNVMVYRMAAGVRLYTDNTTTPSSNTAFANRNYIGRVHANACTEGLSINRANTNLIMMSLQANTEGADIGEFSKNNEFNFQLESNTRPIVIHTSANDNLFGGSVVTTDFVDSGGSQVSPHISNSVIGTATFQFPGDVMMPSSGIVRFKNPYSASVMRFRPEDEVDLDLRLASHDANDVVFDIFGAMYHATAPFGRMYENLLCSKEVEIDGALNHDGTTAGFMGAVPVVRASHIVDPSGGVIIDAESRTAINAILVVLENLGFTATS